MTYLIEENWSDTDVTFKDVTHESIDKWYCREDNLIDVLYDILDVPGTFLGSTNYIDCSLQLTMTKEEAESFVQWNDNQFETWARIKIELKEWMKDSSKSLYEIKWPWYFLYVDDEERERQKKNANVIMTIRKLF